MSINQDRLTVTFYDTEEVKISDEFRAILKQQRKSVNETLKELVIEFVKKNKN